MKTAFNVGTSGLMAYQQKLDVIGNNIANISTTAYKPQETSFNELIYNEMYVNSTNLPLTGNGVKTTVTGINASRSGLVSSQRELDLAIDGEGWFSVETTNGNAYTRDGSFSLSVFDGQAYLVNQAGNYVLNAEGERISAEVSENSSVDAQQLIDQIGVFSFAYQEALTPIGNNCYEANELTGTATESSTGNRQILSGFLEESGVSLSDEMVNLITAQRSYQLSVRVVTTADENEQTLNSIRN